MAKFPILLLACLVPGISSALANGGGYFRGGLESAGDVAGFEPEQTDKIRILDEKLTVRLGPKSAAVEVRYLMRNETAKKVKVRFGFPAEESFDKNLMASVGEPTHRKTTTLSYCRDYRVTAAGKPVKFKWQAEAKPAADKRFEGLAGWMVSELTFAAGEEKPVLISFNSDYPEEEWNVSDAGTISAARFKYRLSTAACWAGTIGEGSIALIPDGIPADELRVIKPVNRFTKEGNHWVWRFKDLEPSLADDLEIEAVPEIRFHPIFPDTETDSWSSYHERAGKWSIEHKNYAVHASTVLPPEGDITYVADNVRDYEKLTIWCEGASGPGKNEWLELTPKVAKPLRFISISPGCWRTPQLFLANARPKRILVELNGSHRFHFDVPDRMEKFLIPVTGFTKPVARIRLTFEEVWPGNKYEDLCVSDISLHVHLDKEPKIGPVR